jgi:uncharacterized protein YbaP (TraB family)
MRRFFVLFFVFLLGIQPAIAHTGHKHKSHPVKPKPAANAPIPLRGTLYRVDYNNHVCYLFGTVHIGQTAFYPLEPQVTRALHDAGKLVIEVNVSDTETFNKAIIRHGLYPDGETLTQHLSPETLAALKQTLQQNRIPFDNVAGMKPWMIANMLIVQQMNRNGYPTEQGLEKYFLDVAKKQKKKIDELETADFQLSLFDNLDESQQEAYLSETLHDLNDGSAVAKSIALIDAWRHADSDRMEALKKEMLTDDSPSSRFLDDILLRQRNPGMTDRIEALLKNEDTTFVAIGALHLIGDDSVPALLKQRGYQVTRMY